LQEGSESSGLARIEEGEQTAGGIQLAHAKMAKGNDDEEDSEMY
jgi:hypothetical protein